MAVKIDKNEFIEEYKNFSDRRTAVLALKKKYEVSEATIYNWIRKYITGIKTSRVESSFESETLQEAASKYYEAGNINELFKAVDIDMNIDSGGILIVMLSDMHIGSRYTDLKRLVSDMKKIKETDGVYAFMLGDILDTGGNKTTPHKGLMNDQIMKYKEAKHIAMKLYEYVGEKILVTTSGCHGAWTFEDTGEYLEEELVKYTDTGIFLNHGGTVNIKMGHFNYRFFVTHKIGGSGTINPTRGLVRLNEIGLDFDVGVAGHNHQASVSIIPRRYKFVYALKCGSYKSLDTHANKNGFVHTPMSIPAVYISADLKKIIPFVNWYDGLRYLW